MKSQIGILLAVVATFFSINHASAVPAKPVDVTALTLLPTEETPNELRKLVAVFGKRIADVNASAETKREQLQKQTKEGFDKAVAKAQTAGDIDAVLALKAAKEQFETLTASDVPLVKNAIDFREKKTAEVETARVADALKAAKDFNDELEKAKKEETTKGNFETAKALSDYQKKLAAWAQSVREAAPAPQFARPTSTAISRSQKPSPVRQEAEPRTVSVYASSANGESIGFAKAGDVFKIQYVGGRWNCKWVEESPDASRMKYQDHRCVLVEKGDPAIQLAVIPGNTKQKPFSFRVSEDGEYALRAWDGMNDWRRDIFGDNHGTVEYSVTKLSAMASAANAPSTGTSPSPFAIRQQDRLGSGETKTVNVSASKPKGGVIGELKAGDRFAIRYLNGTWTCDNGRYPKESPDEQFLDQSAHRAVVVDARNPNYVFVTVPADTASSPFEFNAPEDARFSLRIKDTNNYEDNNGIVSYEVKIYRQGAR